MMKDSNTPSGCSCNCQGNSDPSVAFDEFQHATYEEWKAAAIDALKGVPFEKMVTKLVEGFSLQPIYNPSDVPGLESEPLPGQFNFRRGTSTLGYRTSPWLVAQNIPAVSPADFNEKALHDLQKGQNALNITINPNGLDGLALNSAADWSAAFDGIELSAIPVFIAPGKNGLAALAGLASTAKAKGTSTQDLSGAILIDPLGTLVQSGSVSGELKQNFCAMSAATKWAITNAPKLQTICASGIPYADAGADSIQEIAFTLATALCYLRELQSRGLSVEEIAPRIRFTVSLGNHLFLEIAKLRALRLLWAEILKSCGISAESAKPQIHGRTSGWSISKTDPWVNMLRATAQTFSGIIGGCDSIDVQPFDSAVRVSDEFARRIARNTQLVLQLECDLNKVADPSGGSWYIEWATDQLSRKAWELIQEIEKSGGMAQAIIAGIPQEKVNATAAKRYTLIDSRRQVVVGTNKYTNLTEKPLEATRDMVEVTGVNGNTAAADNIASAEGSAWVCASIEALANGATICDITAAIASSSKSCGCSCSGPGITTATQLPVRRASERFEALHARANAAMQQTGCRPAVFLANMGPLRQFKARADFSQDFLRAGGLDTVYPNGFSSPQDAAKAAAESGCGACVICSTDDTYPELVPAFCEALKAIKPDMFIMLAGYPADQIEAFKAAGVNDFIHIRANCFATLDNLQSKLGL